MATDTIYDECGSHWSQQVSVMATIQWLQRDHIFPHTPRTHLTLPLSVKGAAFETSHTPRTHLLKKRVSEDIPLAP